MEVKIAENIRTMRKAKNLTQEQLAEAMGVTIGAVSKWELGGSVPDIAMIMELADFFETSVDVLLGYSLRSHSVKQAVEELRRLRQEKRFQEGIRAAEKALQKYPNNFEVVYQSGLTYYLTLDSKYAHRAITLLERACQLIDQNTYEKVSEVSIQNQIASCYLVLGDFDEAIERLKKNNHDGMNNSFIGNTISQHYKKPQEALKYLSQALVQTYGELMRMTLGYANAYAELGELDKALEINQWMHEINENLRGNDPVSYLDKDDSRILTICAEICAVQGNEEGAYSYLKQAKEKAEAFDAAPVYSLRNMKYYHGEEEAVSYDDFGSTAMEGIRIFLQDDKAGAELRPIWEQLMKEEQ